MHAFDMCNRVASDCYDVIATCSGDGTMFEAINGIMKRADKDHFLETTSITLLPGGTTNSLHIN
jgi:diacylglycerol kinase family enzyme